MRPRKPTLSMLGGRASPTARSFSRTVPVGVVALPGDAREKEREKKEGMKERWRGE